MKVTIPIPLAYTIPDPRTATTEQVLTFAKVAVRRDLIEFAQRNDRNGCFSDGDCRREMGRALTLAELRAIVRGMASDGLLDVKE